MKNNINFVLFIILSATIWIGFQYFYVRPIEEHYRQQAVAVKPAPQQKAAVAAEPVELRDRAAIIKDEPHVPIATPTLGGSVDLKGARLDDLMLLRYRETVAPDAPPVALLSPAGSAAPHNATYVELSWLADSADIAVPNAETEWKTADKKLTPDHPLRLTWDNGKGLRFERTIMVDNRYMFTVTDHVANTGTAPVTLYPFGLVTRQGNPVVRASSVLHEGPIGVLDGTLEEITYKKLIDQVKKTYDSVGGWLGITDKYWLIALIPPHDEKLAAEYAYDGSGQTDPGQGHFQSDYRGSALTIAPGASAEHTVHVFAGAKDLKLLDAYSDNLDILLFNRAIDFGWFWFLTIPFLKLLNHLGYTLGSFGVAILLFTVMLKLITLPLSLKSNHSMSRMKELQPEIKRLQERFADDKVKQNQEMMELFKREKVSPMSGCVPMLIQIPIFFALYKVLYVGIELRQAPFFGWIKDMSIPDPTSALNLFGLIPVDLPPALHIGAWPILMGCGMFLQQRLSPQPTDKSQARMFMFMPIIFTYMLAQMPAGLVIYWTWSNLLSIVQQWFIMNRDAKRKRG